MRNNLPRKSLKRWQLISEKNISPNPHFPLYLHQVKLPNNKVIDYFISKLGNVAMVVAVTPKKEIIFVRQYKHGVADIILELPAGRIGQKSPEEAAQAELLEETGVNATTLTPLGKILIAPSKDATVTYGFLVMDANINNVQSLDENENIEIVLISAKKVKEKIKNGQIQTADTIALITLAELKHPEIFN